ncbi:MAG: hypothetical protein JWP01_4114 [Myxococcales bacterium]|nr:hypothetical protein [Myxococcales bacterium]
MRGVLLVVGSVLVGCYHPEAVPGAPCSTGGTCPTGLECRAGICELAGTDGSLDALVDAAIDACPVATCQDTWVVGCGAPVACGHGCSEMGGAHCRVLVPSNGVTPDMLVGATADVTANDWNFDTDDGEIRRGNTMLRTAGTGVIAGIGFEIRDGMGVFTANSFRVAQFDDWDADGDNSLVLFAATTISVIGELDVGANGGVAGPGGSDASAFTSGQNCRGKTGRFFSAGFGEGGGGGGGRTAGGNGGASNQAGATGAGGTLCSMFPTTLPLRGGAGGAHGGNSSLNSGGGGGGAVALVAMESISVTGVVGAPGAGGISGASGTAPSGDGGGGGGGGGAVLLEAPSVVVSGALTANGGGGAAPFMVAGGRGMLASGSSAIGGVYTGPGGTARGGRGGTGTLSPGNGTTYAESDATPTVIITRGGGGGGAAGRIEIRSATSMVGGTQSPMPTYADAVLE